MTAPERFIRQLAARPVELPSALVGRTMRRLELELRRRRQLKRYVWGRLTLAAIVSFPFVLAVNAIEAYLLYTVLDRYLPAPVAGLLSATAVLSMLLTLAIAYGSLPLLASLGSRLREQAS